MITSITFMSNTGRRAACADADTCNTCEGAAAGAIGGLSCDEKVAIVVFWTIQTDGWKPLHAMNRPVLMLKIALPGFAQRASMMPRVRL